MNDKEDILSDLENDIDEDWIKIQEKVRKKERKELIEIKSRNPKRFNFPSFSDFYSILYKLSFGKIGQPEWEYDLQELIRNLIHYSDDGKLPKSIIKIWEALCSPKNYIHKYTECRRCRNEYDITYKTIKKSIYYEIYNIFDTDSISNISESKVNRIFCPNCGEYIFNLLDSELFSISICSEKDMNNRRERRYDIKRNGEFDF